MEHTIVFNVRSKAVEHAFLNLAQVLQVAKQINGLCEIEDFSVYKYNKNCCSFFSSNPSLEHNLVSKNYLQYDQTFNVAEHFVGDFMWWSDSFIEEKQELLTYEKLTNFGYSAGCSITKKHADAIVMYSFATKSTKPDIRLYYQKNKDDLISIGDFLYLRLNAVLHNFHNSEIRQAQKGLLKLIVDNVL